MDINRVFHEVFSDFSSLSLEKLTWSVNISLHWILSQLHGADLRRKQKSSEECFILVMMALDLQRRAGRDVLPNSTGYIWEVLELFLEAQGSLTSDKCRAFLSALGDGSEQSWKHRLEEADHSHVAQLLDELFGQDPIILPLVLKEMRSLNLISVSPGTDASKEETSDAFCKLTLKEFEKLRPHLKNYLPHVSSRELKETDRHGVVGLMATNSFRSCVELTEKVLKRMERPDLVSKLPRTPPASLPSRLRSGITENTTEMGPIVFQGSSGTRGPSLGGPVAHELQSAPSATLAIMSKMWSDTVWLSDLSKTSWQCFQKTLPDLLHVRGRPVLQQEAVLWVVLQHGTQSLYKVAVVLLDMGLSDLAQRLIHTATKERGFLWGSDNGDWCKILGVLADGEVLLDTVHELSCREMNHFEWFVQFTCLDDGGVSWIDLECERQSQELEMMSSTCSPLTAKEACVALMKAVIVKQGRQAPYLMNNVFMHMDRNDVGARLRHGYRVGNNWFHMGPALKQKIKEMKIVIKRLMKTLKALSSCELMDLKRALTSEHSSLLWDRLCHYETSQLVFSIVQTYGQGSVALTKNLLESIGRKDLLPGLDSESYEFTSDPWWNALIHMVATLAAATHLLGEILSRLSSDELKQLKKLLVLESLFHEAPHVDLRLLASAKAQQTAALLLQTYGCVAVKTIHWILKKMKSGNLQPMMTFPRRKPSKPKVVEVRDLRLSLCRLLSGLSHEETYRFKLLLQLRDGRMDRAWIQEREADADGLVDLILETSGQHCLRDTTDVLMQMDKMDLVRKSLKGTSLEWCLDVWASETCLLKEIPNIETHLEQLQVVLQELTEQEMQIFRTHLQLSCESNFSRRFVQNYTRVFSELQDAVELLVAVYGESSAGVIIQTALSDMGREDLVEKVSKLYSAFEGLHFVDKFKEELIERVSHITQILDDLHGAGVISSQAYNNIRKLDSSKKKMRELFRQAFKSRGDERKDVFYKILKDREPHLCTLLESHLSTKAKDHLLCRHIATSICFVGDRIPACFLWPEGKGTAFALHEMANLEISEKMRPGDVASAKDIWTRLEPEVQETDNQFTYSLQSAHGRYQCSVSGLRWSCEQGVSFHYRFVCWEEHLERVRGLRYAPAGPLMDITVLSGRLDAVCLPHWLCVDDPVTRDNLAVLHIADYGDAVEKATDVGSSHVKLLEPIFSPRGVLVKAGFPVKVYCSLLIYKKSAAFLTLHVYLIPRDPGLKKLTDWQKQRDGYSVIEKPHPDKFLKIRKKYVLKAQGETLEITPEKLTLRYQFPPNFYEVYTREPDFDFKLELAQENVSVPVWECTIRQDDYTETTRAVPRPQGIHFVDRFEKDLIQRVSNIAEILDHLLHAEVISSEEYDAIREEPTPQEKMRRLFRGALRASGDRGKDVFYTILKDRESFLCASLEESCM